MARGSSHWKKYGTKCENCRRTEPEVKLTRHHVKNSKGNKTGEIKVLCRECHDEVEEKLDTNSK